MKKNDVLSKSIIGVSSFILGVSTTLLICKKPKKEEILGNLRIDNSDSDMKDSLFLELKVPVSYISSKEVVKFKVIKENYIRK